MQYKTQNEDEWVRSGDLGTKKLVYEILNVAPGKIYNVRIGAGNEHGKITGKIAEGKVPFRRSMYIRLCGVFRVIVVYTGLRTETRQCAHIP